MCKWIFTVEIERAQVFSVFRFRSGEQSEVELDGGGAVAVVGEAVDPVLRRQTDADENDDEDIQGNRQKYQSFETLSHSLKRKVPLRVRFVIAFLRCLNLRPIYTRV